MNNLYCIDPHVGALRDHSRRFYELDDKGKRDASNAFMLLVPVLMLISGYIGYLAGRA